MAGAGVAAQLRAMPWPLPGWIPGADFRLSRLGGERLARDPQRAGAGTHEGLRFTAEVQEVREVVDPIDMTTDLANAVSWIYGEPRCDRDRIGLWGSSYSGGHVVYVAARDHA